MSGASLTPVMVTLPTRGSLTSRAISSASTRCSSDSILRRRPPPCELFFITASLLDRKSTRLNSSHPSISYAVFCLKKKSNIDYLIAEPDILDRSHHRCSLSAVRDQDERDSWIDVLDMVNERGEVVVGRRQPVGLDD